MRSVLMVCIGTLAISGCGPDSGDDPGSADTAVIDSSGADTAVVDSGGADTGSPDTSPVDPAGADTIGADADSPDTGSPDAGVVDAGSPDDAGETDDTGTAPGGCETQGVAKALNTKLATVEDSDFIYKKTADPTGLVLMFHGGGGSKEDNLHLRVEPVLIAREALERGYSVASLDSVAHVVPNGKDNYQWNEDDSADNPDVANVIAMVARLTDSEDLNAAPADGPVLLIGISNGGSMASRVAQHLPVAAVAIFVSNAVAFDNEGATIPPLVLCPGQNDPGYALGSNEELASDITAAGGEVIFSPNEPGAVTPGLFTRIDGIDCPLSMSIRAALNDATWLNTDETLANNPKDDKSWQSALPADAVPHEDQISDVLLETYAGHSPSSDKNALVFDFFDQYDE